MVLTGAERCGGDLKLDKQGRLSKFPDKENVNVTSTKRNEPWWRERTKTKAITWVVNERDKDTHKKMIQNVLEHYQRASPSAHHYILIRHFESRCSDRNRLLARNNSCPTWTNVLHEPMLQKIFFSGNCNASLTTYKWHKGSRVQYQSCSLAG